METDLMNWLSFDDLCEMETLLLADNRLKVIHRDVFKELYKLKQIWLQTINWWCCLKASSATI